MGGAIVFLGQATEKHAMLSPSWRIIPTNRTRPGNVKIALEICYIAVENGNLW